MRLHRLRSVRASMPTRRVTTERGQTCVSECYTNIRGRRGVRVRVRAIHRAQTCLAEPACICGQKISEVLFAPALSRR